MSEMDDYLFGEIHYLDLDQIETEDDVLDVFGTSYLTEVYNAVHQHTIVLEQARKFRTIRSEYESEAARRIVFMYYGLSRMDKQ